MTDWQPEFIALWQQGLEIREIAQRLGVPYGTVQSRAHRLQHQGKIQPRGRGGAYPRQRALARQEQTEPPTRADPHLPAPTRESPAMTFIAVAEVQEILSTLKRLDARVEALEHTRTDPPSPTHEAPRIPAPTRAGVQQWTVRLSGALIEILKAEAEKERLQPSHSLEAIVAEWWEARKRSTPSP
jgi:transposase